MIVNSHGALLVPWGLASTCFGVWGLFLAMASNIQIQRDTFVLYKNGAIVDRNDCPEHVTHKKGACTCNMIVRIVYADDRVAQVIFDAVFLEKQEQKGTLF